MSLNSSTPRLNYVTGSYQTIIDGWNLPVMTLDNMPFSGPLVNISASHAMVTGTAAFSRFKTGFKWNDYGQTGAWVPQGLSSTGDAYPSGMTPNGRKILACSLQINDASTRITFADVTDPDAVTFQHAFLVEPVMSGSSGSCKDVANHAGGVAWVGDLMYICDTNNGLRVFDVSQIRVMATSSWNEIGLQPDGTIHARGYLYALPQVARHYEVAPFNGTFSYCGLLRDPYEGDAILTGQYNSAAGTSIYCWPLGVSGSLVLRQDGYARANKMNMSVTDMSLQGGLGAVDVDGKFRLFLTSTNPDRLYRRHLDEAASDVNYTWPENPEGITYFPQDDELWTVTELTNKRIVFAVSASML